MNIIYTYVAMMLAVINFSTPANAGIFGVSSFSECILDEMPDARNDTVAREKMRMCRKDFPTNTAKMKKSSFFGFSSSSECIIKYAEDTSSKFAARQIMYACNRLYPR